MRNSSFQRARDPIEIGYSFRGKLECGGGQIFAQVPYRRCPRNKKNVRGALEQPCERDLHWRRAKRRSNRVERA